MSQLKLNPQLVESVAETGFLTGLALRWFFSRTWAQWGIAQTLGVALLLLPVQFRWAEAPTVYARLGAIASLSLALNRGEKMLQSMDLTVTRNQTSHQIKMERIAHALQLDRTVRKRELRELSGVKSLEDLMDFSVVPGQVQALPSAEAKAEELRFELHRLNPTDPTKGKNILIVAGQGIGKTTLAIYIAGEILQSPDIQVYDLDDDGKTWGNLPVWGTGDDASEIAGAMQADAELFKQRTEQRISGDRFPFSVRILDETPSVVQRIPKQYAGWSFMMTSRARKRALIAILLSQFRDPEMNGLKPDQQKTAFATFYLGWKQTSHALNYLVKPKTDADRLRAALDACQRPCLVYFDDGWYWYDVPDLEQWTEQFLSRTREQVNPTSDTQLGLKPPKSPSQPPFDRSKLPPKGGEFLGYIVDKKAHEEEWFSTRIIADNWGRYHFGSTDEFKHFLALLITAGAVISRDMDLSWFCLTAGMRELYGNF